MLLMGRWSVYLVAEPRMSLASWHCWTTSWLAAPMDQGREGGRWRSMRREGEGALERERRELCASVCSLGGGATI